MLVVHLAHALHILDAVGQGRRVDPTQHVAEKRLVFGLADTQHGLCHIIAKRHRGAQPITLAGQKRDQLVTHHLQGTVVHGDMVELQGGGQCAIGLLGLTQQAD
ncbi:hypothetical protein PAGU2196_13760 [Pseudomonas sp. PAGU 2196]|nr:hypothetical protein PAGU2196_13760 [Pseudomonas sp. PAGU 2196]